MLQSLTKRYPYIVRSPLITDTYSILASQRQPTATSTRGHATPTSNSHRWPCRSSLHQGTTSAGRHVNPTDSHSPSESSELRTPMALGLQEHTSSGSKKQPPIDTSPCYLVFAQRLTIMLTTTTTTTRSTADFNRVRFFTNVVLTCWKWSRGRRSNLGRHASSRDPFLHATLSVSHHQIVLIASL
ncbi:hypothetical protein B0T18DRAFT_12193 [Schizothecium vesticola]|uniref:Uncharacterized protein n=1 Tax=Schizothecium vesticola TaxID=314040 RepID=A0AA40KBP8_9PEZI|nr:hypothetical protein B0T18DRAFT_12193 [Schizothecium vesticola]